MVHELDAAVRRPARKILLDGILTELSQASSPDLQPLLRALQDPDRVPHRYISRWLTDHGYPISPGAVYEYRNHCRLDAWLDRNGIEVENA